ncbi:hypothetical protein ASC99_34545 [Kitasatospora sp. Root107]|nr:hypothetical protein ASC99_34545 [Kitasatospora sp. Root107]
MVTGRRRVSGEPGESQDVLVRGLPGDDRRTDSGPVGAAHYLPHHLAEQAGGVVPALAGDDQVRVRQRLVQPEQLGDRSRPGRDDGAPGGRQAVRGAPGRTGAGLGRVTAEQLGEPGQSPFELLDVGWTCALLRTVHGGRTLRAEQGIAHVSEQLDAIAGGGPELAPMDPTGSRERAPAIGQGDTVGVEQSQAEGPQQAGTAVGGGGTAESDHHAPRALVEGGGDELTGAPSGGGERGEFRHQRQAADGGEFDHGGAVREQRVLPVDGTAVGAGTAAHPVQGSSRVGGRDGGESALAAVGHRTHHQLIVRSDGAPALGQRPGRVGGRHGALE